MYHSPTQQHRVYQQLVYPLGEGWGLSPARCLFQSSPEGMLQCLLIVNAMAVVATLLLGIKNFQIFVLSRLFQGYCTGLLSSIAPLMMKELSPIEISGTLTSCHQIFITCGATFGFVFSLFLDFFISTPSFKWTVLYGFSLVIIICQSYLLTTKFQYETPKYLLLNQQEQEAKQLIKVIYKDDYVDEVLKEMKDNLRHGNTSQGSFGERETSGIQLNEKKQDGFTKTKTQTAQSQQKLAQPSTNQMSTPRSAVIAALHLAMLQQLCGVNAVVAYGGEIVGERQPGLKLAMPIIINMLQFVGALMASFLLTRVGRKFLLQMGALTTAVGASMVGVGFVAGSLGWILFGLITFMACFGITLGPVVWIYLPEVAQPKILSYATAANWGTCSLVMLLFPIIKKMLPNENPAALFFFFAIWSICSYFINLRFIIETRNKGEKQINSEYENLKSFI